MGRDKTTVVEEITVIDKDGEHKGMHVVTTASPVSRHTLFYAFDQETREHLQRMLEAQARMNSVALSARVPPKVAAEIIQQNNLLDKILKIMSEPMGCCRDCDLMRHVKMVPHPICEDCYDAAPHPIGGRQGWDDLE